MINFVFYTNQTKLPYKYILDEAAALGFNYVIAKGLFC